MKKTLKLWYWIAVVTIISVSLIFLVKNEPALPVTQEILREMIDEWMENPQGDDREKRLEIMKAYYIFEELGQKLSDDQEGRVLLNQIRKMVSIDIPKAELDQIRQEIRDELKEQGFEVRE